MEERFGTQKDKVPSIERAALLRQIGREIYRETQQGQKSLFQIFKDRIVDKINYGSQQEDSLYTPPEALEIAIGTRSPDYVESNFNFGLIVLYNTLGLTQDNVVEKLRPFLDTPATRRSLSDRLISAYLAVVEDTVGLKRDTLYTPFTNPTWLKG